MHLDAGDDERIVAQRRDSGTSADAIVGPPLTGIARRVYLAGHLTNSPENMMDWIRHPHAHDVQTAMPEMGVTESDSRDIVTYLYTLR